MTTSIHPETRIGLLSLTVTDLARSIDFYTNAMGFVMLKRYEGDATLGVGTTEFDLSKERALALYDSGRWAAEKFLDKWDFDAYIAEFRSGKEHSRRADIAAELQQTGAPA